MSCAHCWIRLLGCTHVTGRARAPGAISHYSKRMSKDRLRASCTNRFPSRSSMRSITRTSSAKWYRSEEHTSELQSLMRISYAVFCWKKKHHIYTREEQSDTTY